MNDVLLAIGRHHRTFVSVGMAAAIALASAGCSTGGGSTGGTATGAPDGKLALTALDAGLKAHAAGDLGAATTDYHRTLAYDPTNKFALYNLALIDAANGNYGLAEAKYRSALEADASYEPALFNLAILRTPRDAKEAISLYERAVAANRSDASALLNLGLLLRANGRKAIGDKDVFQATVMNPKLRDPVGASTTKP